MAHTQTQAVSFRINPRLVQTVLKKPAAKKLRALLFAFASDEAGYITAQTLGVNGGAFV